MNKMKLDHQHVFPWLFLSISSYRPSLKAGFPNYMKILHLTNVNTFLLLSQNWRIHVKGSIEERHLWVRPYFRSSFSCVLLVLLA